MAYCLSPLRSYGLGAQVLEELVGSGPPLSLFVGPSPSRHLEWEVWVAAAHRVAMVSHLT